MAEHPAVNRRVAGSSPARGAFFYVYIITLFRGIVQLVERRSPKPNVKGSSPFAPVFNGSLKRYFPENLDKIEVFCFINTDSFRERSQSH